MAALTVLSKNSHVGASIDGNAAAAAVGGDTFRNDGKTFLYIRNDSVSSITVTLSATPTPAGLTITPPTISVANNSTVFAGPFDPAYMNDANGNISITYSAVTSVTICPISVG